MLSSFSPKKFFLPLTIIMLATSACAGKKDEPPPQAATQACPPLPSPCPAPPEAPDSILELANELGLVKEKLSETAAKMQVTDKIGKKELSPEEFGKMASFLWAVDPALRVAYLRALDRTNQLADMVKPPDGGKFDLVAVPADPEQDIAFRISEVIVDWALVQRMFVDGMRALGAENVMLVSAHDDFPQGEAMMKELIPLVTPPEAAPATPATPATPADKLLPGALRLIVPDAFAQTQKPAKGAKVLPKVVKATAPVKAMAMVKAMPRVTVAKAPLLLARTMSYKVGNSFFVLDSPFMKSIPEFQAVPVEQFTFKLERKIIGDAYFNEVSGVVNQLAAIPKRSQVEWREMAYGLTELQVALKLLNPNFGEAPPAASPVPGAAPIPTVGTQPTGTQPVPVLGTPTQPAGGAAPPPPSPSRPDTAPSSAAPPSTERPSGSSAVPSSPAKPEPTQPSGAPPPVPKP